MKSFFLNQQNDLNIKLFSIYHFFLIFIVFLMVGLIILNKKRFITMEYKTKKRIRYILLAILLLNLMLRRGSFIYYGVYNYKIHLDINFCNFTNILFIIYCVFGNKNIYKICYYMTFIGPLLSILFPSTDISPLNYSFYSFIILHHVVFIFNIIFMFTENLKYTKKDFYIVLIFLILYLSSTWLFNFIFNTTYNIPLTFINITLNNFIPFYSLNLISSVLIMLLVILINLIIASKFLKSANK